MRILYLHGLASSKQANTARKLKGLLKGDEVESIDIPMNPFKAFECISSFIEEHRPDLLLGTSLGGFYASLFKGPMRILVNPALNPDREIKRILGGFGTFPYVKEREDGATHYEYSKEDERQFKTLKERALEEVYPLTKEATYAFFGDEDATVNDKAYYEERFLKEHAFLIHAEHRLKDENILNDIAPFIICLKMKGFEDELLKRGDKPLREFMKEFLASHGK